ncbi:nucleotidyltransferase family protein [Aliiglaciecola sp. NS0011-25]|uniref:nucleotidyltransferase family protein n=1 Tax=Aliiglaciecola sp. NS0011-25 TaxID=3127654 RepID=UPI003102F055
MLNSPQTTPKLVQLSKLILADLTSLQSIGMQDAQALTDIAIEHGVAALLAQVLEHHKLKRTFFASLINYQMHQSLRNQLLEQQFHQTLTQLTESGVQFVVLKGYALGHTVYTSPLLRTKSDVDIFINSDDKNEIIEVFESMGFRNPRGWNPTAIINQFSMRETLSPGVNVDFDIHLRLSNELGVENILKFDELANAADTKTLRNIPLVCKSHGLIHAIVHLLHHRNVGDAVKLIWLYDLLLLCRQMTHSEKAHFRQCVDEKGLGTLAKFALELANSYFKDESIHRVLGLIDGASSNPELIYLTTIDSRSKQLQRSLQQRKSLPEKWLFIKETAFPPAQEIYQKYGKQPGYLMPFFYIRRLIGGVIKYLAN